MSLFGLARWQHQDLAALGRKVGWEDACAAAAGKLCRTQKDNVAAIQEWFSDPDFLLRDPDQRNAHRGESLLHIAAFHGSHCDILRVILAHGASVNATDVSDDTPLDDAALMGHS